MLSEASLNYPLTIGIFFHHSGKVARVTPRPGNFIFFLSDLKLYFPLYTLPYVIDSSIQYCRLTLKCLWQISEYIGMAGLSLAYRAEPSCVQLQNMVPYWWWDLELNSPNWIVYSSICWTKLLCSTHFIPLERHCHAAARY